MEPGYVLDDRYVIEALVGKGGHGKVYRALDRDLSCPVAIKVLYGDVAAEEEFRERMSREARAMGQLAGTSAVQIMAFNKTSWGALYLVMEYLEGSDLNVYCADAERAGERVPIGDVIDILEPIADTLQKAHERGIIHRDAKGGNVFVMTRRARGWSRLLDFSGRLPFDVSVPIDHLLRAVTREDRPSLHALRPDLPPAIDGWVRRALAIDREERFVNVATMWRCFVHAVGA